MLSRRFLPILAGVFACSVAVASANPNGVAVLRSGERVSGPLAFNGGNNATIAGRTIDFSQIAFISFGGDPAAAEVQQLPTSDHGPELQAHMITLRDGTIIHGKFYKFSPDGETITIDVAPNAERRDVPSGQIARMYFSPEATRSVFSGPASGAPASSSQPVATGGSRRGFFGRTRVTVAGNQPWTNTGVAVNAGDTYRFDVNGTVQYTSDPNEKAERQGSLPQHRVPGSPIPNELAGALIARIDNGQPFLIGGQQEVRMPASGTLYLGINDDNTSDNSGQFDVGISKR